MITLQEAIESAKVASNEDGIISQYLYNQIVSSLDDKDRYAFTMALVDLGINTRYASNEKVIYMSEVLGKKIPNFRKDIIEDFVEVSNIYFNNDRREAYMRSDDNYEYFLEFNPFNVSNKVAYDPYDYVDEDMTNSAIFVRVGKDYIDGIFREVLGDRSQEALSIFYKTEVSDGKITNIEDHWIRDSIEENYGKVSDPGGGNYYTDGIFLEIVPGSDVSVFTRGWDYSTGDPYVGEESGYSVSENLNEQDSSNIINELTEYFRSFAEEISEEL
jgi:hypothetical protein